METPLFRQLVAKVDAIAAAARAVLKADEETLKRGIPGPAKWNGFNEDGHATVKLNDKIYVVNLVTNTVPKIGTTVYVDETFNVEYKNVKPKEPVKQDEENVITKKRPTRKQRRTKHPIFLDVNDVATGATWLVYPEVLHKLEETTVAEAVTNPRGYEYNLFLQLAGALVLGGGVLIAAFLYGSLEESVEFFTLDMRSLEEPQEHPNIPEGLDADDFTKVVMLQGVYDSAQVGTPLWLPLDGFYCGVGSIFDDTVVNILLNDHGGEGVIFSQIKAVNPDRIFDDLFCALYMFEIAELLLGSKIQAGLVRANGVYPPKNINLNIHAWPALVNRPIDYTDEDSIQNTLPEAAHIQFRIPEDIPEWDYLSGAGGLDYTNLDGPHNYAYDIVPIHRLHEYKDDVEPLDSTKFCSYSGPDLFLHYVVICYAPWTGFGEDLRINYYNLNLKFTISVDDSYVPSIASSYTITPGTFNVPNYFEVLGDIITEMAEFPLQAGDRNKFTEQITFRITGVGDPGTVNPTASVFARRGDDEKYGITEYLSQDAPYVEYIDGETYYHDSRAPVFSHTDLPGFDIHPRTGEWVFDQNVSAYANINPGDVLYASVVVTVEAPGDLSLSQTITFQILGYNTNYISGGSTAPAASLFVYETVDAPPSHSYDPEPYVENTNEESNYEAEEFDEITVFVPFPEITDDGSAFSWQGQNPKITFDTVDDPVITWTIGDNHVLADEVYVSKTDFDFDVITSLGNVSPDSGFEVRFKPITKDYNFLPQGETISITYTLVGQFNRAPYVGNFEDLNEYQRKSLRGSALFNADPYDWRYDIYNPMEETSYLGYMMALPDEEAAMRDGNIMELNISPLTQTVSAGYIHEFIMKGDKSPKEELLDIDNTKLYYTSRLRYEFDEETNTLLFYDKQGDNEPLDIAGISQILSNSADILKKRYFSVEHLLPDEFDRDDSTGTKWRKHSFSKDSYGFLIYAYLPVG